MSEMDRPGEWCRSSVYKYTCGVHVNVLVPGRPYRTRSHDTLYTSIDAGADRNIRATNPRFTVNRRLVVC